MIEFLNRLNNYPENVAIISEDNSCTYEQLEQDSNKMARQLLGTEQDLKEQRVALIVDPGYDYVKSLLAIWKAGGIAVPLHPKAKPETHMYVLEDAAVSHLILGSNYQSSHAPAFSELKLKEFATELEIEGNTEIPNISSHRGALILYTSGTTGSPKGVLTTHDNISAQITSLVKAWEWSSADHIINVLPMHHVHGIINVLCCALWSGAKCEFKAFDADKILNRLGEGDVNLFMAVPTIYYKLIQGFHEISKDRQAELSQAFKKFRLMVSGSAALPVSVLEQWKAISGQVLLERYGMTEIGMAVSNSYSGIRIPGHIGQALPGVEIRLIDDEGKVASEGDQGEIQIKSNTVFKKYWGKPEATKKAFSQDGWFVTGDIATCVDGVYKIVGRKSIDIIKSGGYKLSALEIEEVIRACDHIDDCGVVGIPNEEWGEVVAAGLVVKEKDRKKIDLEELRDLLLKKLAPYKIPRIWKFLDELPRNAMGKVVKNELKEIMKREV